jgi:hypothetical protein
MNMMRRIMSTEEQLRLAATIKAERDQKLQELGSMIRGTPIAMRSKTKGASNYGSINHKPKVTVRLRLNEKQKKLGELGKMIRG